MTVRRHAAVARGLVLAKIQEMQPAMHVERLSRKSYGVIVREPYNARVHRGEYVELDSNQRTWALNQIDWIIRKVGLRISIDLTPAQASS